MRQSGHSNYTDAFKGWKSTSLFFDGCKTHFIPEVKLFLIQVNRPSKALLILDNTLYNPKTNEINFDLNSSLPQNFTAILQSIDQNLIQKEKLLTGNNYCSIY